MKKASIALLILYVVLYILPLGARPISIIDEARYSEIPREMIETGVWSAPYLVSFRYFEKPVMGYWLTALSMMAFGENAFAVRFPSALSAGVIALSVYLVARKFAGQRAGIVAAAVQLLCLEPLAVGVTNVLDTMFSMFVVVSLLFFFLAAEERRRGARWMYLFLFGLVCGFAFMTKGFVAFAVAGLTAGAYLALQRRWRDLFIFPWVPMLVAVAVSTPWAIAVHLRESDYWHYFFYVEHIQRFLEESSKQHPEPFWFFLPILVAGFLPWSVVLPAALAGLRGKQWRSPIVRYCLLWFALPFLFFSASTGKLGTYILPCFPALAILVGIGLPAYLERGRTRTFAVGAGILAAIAGIGALALLVIHFIPSDEVLVYNSRETWKWIMAVAGFGVWSGMIVASIRARTAGRRLVLFAAAPVLVFFSAHFAIPSRVAVTEAAGSFLMKHADMIQPGGIVASDKYLAPSIAFFYKNSDIYLLDSKGEFEYGLGFDDSKHRLLTIGGFNQLVEKNTGPPITVFTSVERWENRESVLPKPIYMDVEDKLVFLQF